ncbi:MAG: hypothetical protein QOH90_1207, partial [Actinomycetota bacterium]|nr:hypothetical protein [Actinomycetota bacterium]
RASAIEGASRMLAGRPPTGVPHSPQNFSSGSSSDPQFAQRSARADPQLVQNLRPSLFWAPHSPQNKRALSRPGPGGPPERSFAP